MDKREFLLIIDESCKELLKKHNFLDSFKITDLTKSLIINTGTFGPNKREIKEDANIKIDFYYLDKSDSSFILRLQGDLLTISSVGLSSKGSHTLKINTAPNEKILISSIKSIFEIYL